MSLLIVMIRRLFIKYSTCSKSKKNELTLAVIYRERGRLSVNIEKTPIGNIIGFKAQLRQKKRQ